jgi:hypothetical protein
VDGRYFTYCIVGALGNFPYCAAGVDLCARFMYPVPWLDAFMKVFLYHVPRVVAAAFRQYRKRVV